MRRSSSSGSTSGSELRNPETKINTNPIEDYYSIFKRGHGRRLPGLLGKRLHPYLAEFDFRYCKSGRIRVKRRSLKKIDGSSS